MQQDVRRPQNVESYDHHQSPGSESSVGGLSIDGLCATLTDSVCREGGDFLFVSDAFGCDDNEEFPVSPNDPRVVVWTVVFSFNILPDSKLPSPIGGLPLDVATVNGPPAHGDSSGELPRDATVLG